ncbi:MAG: tetratricopeptide repeat protein [Candidatus Cloacimonetes bacterium]|nr:tetratricopeptide repeat protein [Candidatus Cloacimonadota bacterium]
MRVNKIIVLISLMILLFVSIMANELKLSGEAKKNLRSANMYYGMGEDKYEKSFNLYKKVLEENPEFINAFSLLESSNYVFFIYKFDKTYFEVYDLSQELVEKSTNILKKYNEMKENDPKGAKRYIKKEIKLKEDEIKAIRDNNSRIHASCWAKIFTQGQTKFDNKQYEESLQNYNDLLKLAPDSTKTLKMIARNYNSLDRFDEEKETLIKISKMDKEDLNIRLQLAGMYFDEKEFEDAANWYNKAAKIEPKEASHYFNMGICYNQLKNTEKSTEMFSKVIEYDQNNFDAYIYLSRSTDDQVEKEKYIAKAYEIVQKAIEKDPDNIDAYTNASGLASKLGKKEESADYLIKAVDINPTNKELLYKVANRLQRLKRYKEAYKYSNMLIELGSPSEDAKQLHNWIKQSIK